MSKVLKSGWVHAFVITRRKTINLVATPSNWLVVVCWIAVALGREGDEAKRLRGVAQGVRFYLEKIPLR
jgi:hypothetical protein